MHLLMLNQWRSIAVGSPGWALPRPSSMHSSPQGVLAAALLFWGRRGSFHLSKVNTWTPQPLGQPWSHSAAAMDVCQVGTLIASVKNMHFFYFQLSSLWKSLLYVTGNVLIHFCSFAFQLSFSFHVSQCLTRNHSSLCSLCDRAHPHTQHFWDTFWTRDVCHKAYSLAFYKDLNNLQNLDPAAVLNKWSPDLQSSSTVLSLFCCSTVFLFQFRVKNRPSGIGGDVL